MQVCRSAASGQEPFAVLALRLARPPDPPRLASVCQRQHQPPDPPLTQACASIRTGPTQACIYNLTEPNFIIVVNPRG